MPVITIQHQRHRTGAREERSETTALVQTSGVETPDTVPSGSFDMNGLSAIEIGQSRQPGTALIGSVSSPNTRQNSVSFESVLDQGANLGSASPSGTVQAVVTAYGF